MERPPIKDKEASKYVDYLEQCLKNYTSEKTIALSYLALKNFVDENNKILSTTKLNKSAISDKDDKYIERMLKFAKEVKEYNENLEQMEKKIKPHVMEDAKKISSSVYEDALRNGE